MKIFAEIFLNSSRRKVQAVDGSPQKCGVQLGNSAHRLSQHGVQAKSCATQATGQCCIVFGGDTEEPMSEGTILLQRRRKDRTLNTEEWLIKPLITGERLADNSEMMP